MTGGPDIDYYDWPGGREAMLCFGPLRPLVLLALPLFEEYNRTRTFAVTLLHMLAGRGIGGMLPDWPGTGESRVPTDQMTLAAIRAAYRALVDDRAPIFAVSIRSGALLDVGVPVVARWHLAPQEGAELIRELERQRSAEGDVAGNVISALSLAELAGATVAPARVLRMESDPRPADRKLQGSPIWRRAEPANDRPLAQILADDIADWIATCVA